jgi:serine/threonine-protein kinase
LDYYVGKVLDGRYEIQEVLGVGGMAVVYRAYDNIDDRPVAVKVLKEEFLANEEFRRRFKNESKAIAMLSHPNIVKVYDVSYGERLQYIVMEYVEGITLKEYIEQRRVIPWKEAVHFLTQILRALQHAHDKGVVHRDVKPQNIMLLHSGNIKVTDFGIARFSRSETRTMGENAIGSVHYISPEQARGDLTDGKSDIYSVGVVLYEMLTGELPFQSDSTLSVAIMQLQTEPRRPRELNDQIPPGLEQITIRAMQKNPAERYQSAAEMLLDLEEFKRNPLIRFEYSYFVDREPTKYVSPIDRPRPQRPALPPEEDGEAAARSRLVPAMVGIVAGLVVVLAVVFSLYYFLNRGDNSVLVRKFEGMKYTDIQSNMSLYDKDYNITFKIEPSNRPSGTVFQQEPAANTKQRRGDDGLVKLTLHIAQEATNKVPDVKGKLYADAKRMIEEAGFQPAYETEFDLEMGEGKAIRTEPVAGKQLVRGQVVKVFVAVAKDGQPVDMPDLITWDIETAKELLQSVGLVMDPKVEQEDSDVEEGKVCWQSYEAGKKVDGGSTVTVRVSSGKTPARTVTLRIPLPAATPDGQTEGLLRYYVNKTKVKDETVLLTGWYSGTVEGAEADSQVEVTLDGTRIYTAKVDFTADPPVITDEQSYINVPTVPDVTGMTEQQAYDELNAAGYDTISVERRRNINPFAQRGVVGSQAPRGGSGASYSTQIILYVNE